MTNAIEDGAKHDNAGVGKDKSEVTGDGRGIPVPNDTGDSGETVTGGDGTVSGDGKIQVIFTPPPTLSEDAIITAKWIEGGMEGFALESISM